MTALRVLMLLIALVICYLFFLRSQAPVNLRSAEKSPAGEISSDPAAHSQYKQAMDKAHSAAKQMQEGRADADSL